GINRVEDAKSGQQMRRVGRPAAGDEIYRVEVAEQKDRRQQGQDQIEVGEQRKSYVGEPAQPSGTIDLGRVINLLWDRHSASEQDHGPKRQPPPDMGADGRTESEPARIEPGRAVDTEQDIERV